MQPQSGVYDWIFSSQRVAQESKEDKILALPDTKGKK